MRRKIQDLEHAFTCLVKEYHRLMLRLHLAHIDYLDAQSNQLESVTDNAITVFDETADIECLSKIPGVSEHAAQIILAELGSDMPRVGQA